MSNLSKGLSILFLLTFLMQAKGQNQITIETNSPRIGDTMVRYEVEYTSPGDGGSDAIWDFTNSHPTGKRYEDILFCDSDSTKIRSVEVNAIYSYTLGEDSLLLIRYETPHTMLEFDDPLLMTIYPSEMGTRFDDSYSAHGLYSGRLPIAAGGMVSVETDAEGMLILNQGDTLRNVLRLHSVRTGYSLRRVVIPDSVTEIGMWAFAGDSVLTDVWLPKCLNKIEYGIFLECTNLKTINIPPNVTEIRWGAFEDCSGIRKVYSYLEEPIPESYYRYSLNFKNCILYVPKGTKGKYEQVEPWNKFHEIIEMDE